MCHTMQAGCNIYARQKGLSQQAVAPILMRRKEWQPSLCACAPGAFCLGKTYRTLDQRISFA